MPDPHRLRLLPHRVHAVACPAADNRARPVKLADLLGDDPRCPQCGAELSLSVERGEAAGENNDGKDERNGDR